MKKILFIFMATTFYLAAKAQTNDTVSDAKKDSSVFVSVENVPEFPGGLDKMMHYFNKNLKYPKEARNNNIEGTVRVSFVVEHDGTLTNVKIEKSLSSETDAEAIRLMNNSPKWVPGMQGGPPGKGAIFNTSIF